MLVLMYIYVKSNVNFILKWREFYRCKYIPSKNNVHIKFFKTYICMKIKQKIKNLNLQNNITVI